MNRLRVPSRCYSVSNRAGCPGARSNGSRVSAISWTGFSSKQTRGRFESPGSAYRSNTASMRPTNSAPTLGAVLVNERVYASFDIPSGRHFANGSSTDGHPVSCAAASATLAALTREKVPDNVRRQEGPVLDGLRQALGSIP